MHKKSHLSPRQQHLTQHLLSITRASLASTNVLVRPGVSLLHSLLMMKTMIPLLLLLLSVCLSQRELVSATASLTITPQFCANLISAAQGESGSESQPLLPIPPSRFPRPPSASLCRRVRSLPLTALLPHERDCMTGHARVRCD